MMYRSNTSERSSVTFGRKALIEIIGEIIGRFSFGLCDLFTLDSHPLKIDHLQPSPATRTHCATAVSRHACLSPPRCYV